LVNINASYLFSQLTSIRLAAYDVFNCIMGFGSSASKHRIVQLLI